MRTLERKTDINKIAIYSILVLATLVSMFLRLFYGWDQDESYVMVLPIKISEGSRLFSDLWDLHQTSAIFMAVFCKFYISMKGSYEGIALFLRVVSLLVQVAVSGYVFVVLRKYYSELSALLSAVVVANMLPRATQQLEYGALTMWTAIVANIMLLDYYKAKKQKRVTIAVAAVFYSISVLSYPTMVITILVYFLLFVFVLPAKRNDGVKDFTIFFLTCAVLALVFLVWVIYPIGVSVFLENLRAMSDSGDHPGFFSALTNFDWVIKSAIRIIVFIILAVVITAIANVVFQTKISAFYYYILIVTALVLVANLSGVRPSGPFGFLERYIGVVFLGLPFFVGKKDRELKWILYVGGIACFFGAIMGTNLGLNESAMYFEMSIIACLLVAGEKVDKNGTVFELFCLSFFVFGVAFASGYFVRINSTAPANVTQCTERFESGPLKGISIKHDQMVDISRRYEAVSKLTQEGQVYAVLGNEPLYNMAVKGTTSAPRYVTTVQYNNQWIEYYDTFRHDLPQTILVNTNWYPDINSFYGTIWGKWVQSKYVLEETEYKDVYYMLKLKEFE